MKHLQVAWGHTVQQNRQFISEGEIVAIVDDAEAARLIERGFAFDPQNAPPRPPRPSPGSPVGLGR